MRIRAVLLLYLSLVSVHAYGQTNTPLPEGAVVEVQTRARTVIGTLQPSNVPNWVIVLEEDASQPTLIRLDSVETVRQLRAAAPSSAADAAAQPARAAPPGVAAQPLRVEALSPAAAPSRETTLPGISPAAESAPGRWVLRSKHFVWGMPQLTRNLDFASDGGDSDVPGVSVLVREGFVVGHHDRFKVPMWVSMRWTDEDLQESENLSSLPRPFRQDFELPRYARAEDSYPGHSSHLQDRGHMARHADNRAYGRDNSDAGCLMSNIVPQQAHLNRGIWNDLEDEHRNVVGLSSLGVDQLWVISGPIFANHTPEFTVANDVGVPGAFYKVIGWFRDGEFHARGYVLERFADDDDLASYLTPIDQIEEVTGLDFFPELEDNAEDALEAATFSTLWGDN